MKRLGEILLDWGVIALPELHTGLEACRRSGGRLGTQLLKFGFVSEHSLLEALSEQCNVPSASERMLRRAPLEVRKLLPPKVARRLEAVPFGRTANGLRVALTNPGDPLKIEELVEITGARIEAFVATEAAILGLVSEVEDEMVEMVSEVGRNGSAGAAGDGGWDELWAPCRLRPEALLTQPRRRRPAADQVSLATFPGLEAVDEAVSNRPEHEIDDVTFREQLAGARHRDDVGRLLLRLAARYLARLCLFAVHRGSVVGWLAKGQSVVVDDVQSFSLSLDEPSLFRDLMRRPERHLGPLPAGPQNSALATVLGDPPPAAVLVLPIRVKDRTVAFLVGDNPGESEVAVPVEELAAAVRKVGAALEILIIRKKILS